MYQLSFLNLDWDMTVALNCLWPHFEGQCKGIGLCVFPKVELNMYEVPIMKSHESRVYVFWVWQKKFWGRLLLLCWLVLPKKFEFNFRYNKLCLNKLHYSLWFLHHVKAIYHLFWHEKSIYFISDCIQILWARQISITVTTYLKTILLNSKNVNSRNALLSK